MKSTKFPCHSNKWANASELQSSCMSLNNIVIRYFTSCVISTDLRSVSTTSFIGNYAIIIHNEFPQHQFHPQLTGFYTPAHHSQFFALLEGTAYWMAWKSHMQLAMDIKVLPFGVKGRFIQWYVLSKQNTSTQHYFTKVFPLIFVLCTFSSSKRASRNTTIHNLHPHPQFFHCSARFRIRLWIYVFEDLIW